MQFPKTMLITGGAGFIGSNFIHYFLEKHKDYNIVNLDNLTYAGNLENLAGIQNKENYSFIKGSICDKNLVYQLFEKHNFTSVIHFAAESHVDNSIASPETFIHTNIMGTFTLLNTELHFWKGKDNNGILDLYRFHHISTDEVYGSLGVVGHFSEDSPYAPNSPYSASKASSDMLARSYVNTYKMNITISNCSNNYGPRQHHEKLIPTIIRNAINRNQIPIYGTGENIRDWLYVEDHCRAIDLIFHNSAPGEVYNIGGDNELTNLELANVICEILDEAHPREDGRSYKEQITFVKDRAGHDFRYSVDSSKIKRDLGWSPSGEFMDHLIATVRYYVNLYKA